MKDEEMLDYVNAGAALMGLPLDAARARRVAEHLQRTAALAGLLEQAALVVSDEPAEVYRLARPLDPQQTEPRGTLEQTGQHAGGASLKGS